MKAARYVLGVVAVCGSLSGCEEPEDGDIDMDVVDEEVMGSTFVEDDFRLGIREEVTPDHPSTWRGYDLGLAPGRKWYRGRLKVDRDGTPMQILEVDDRPEAQRPDLTPNHFVSYDPETDEVYEFELAEGSLSAIIEFLGPGGAVAGRGPQDTPEDAVFEDKGDLSGKEWGGNTDDRVRRGIADNGLTAYNKIGQTTSGCTATLVGTPETDEDFIVMAAHCLWNSSGTYLDPNFRPRRDGTGTGSGSSPYGTWDGFNWIMSQYWIDNCIGMASGGTSVTSACVANDIVIQRVGRPSGQGDIGAYGFGHYTNSTLNNTSKFHRGYPSCGTGGPSPCTPNTLYGDGAYGSVTGSHSSGGWDRILYYDSDLNGGHSGGPSYISSSGVKVFAVQSAQQSACFGSTVSPCPPGARPNMMRRIEPVFYGWMLDFIAQYPN